MKEFDSPRQNIDMKIEERLRQADPARNAEVLDEGLVLKAAKLADARRLAGDVSEASWITRNPRRLTLGLSGLVTATALATAFVVVLPGSEANKPLPSSTNSIASGGQLPTLPEPISYSNFGQYISPEYNSSSQALAVPNVVAGVALMTKNVDFSPSKSILKLRPSFATIYKVTSNETVLDTGKKLAELFALEQPLRISKPGRFGSTTATVGSIPSTPTLPGIGQPNSPSYRSVAVTGSKNGISWVYGNSRAMAWRPCKSGDSMNKNVSIISRGGSKGHTSCQALPSGLGPTSTEALDRAKQLFQGLGYQTGTTVASTPEGGLYLVAQGFGEQIEGRLTYYLGTVSGFLKIGGQVTTLAQKVFFTSSSKQIVSAQGFIGNAKPVYTSILKSPAIAARQISVYDQGPDSMQLIDLKNPGSYIRIDYSTSIKKAPNGNPVPHNAKTKTIYISKFHLVPGVIQGTDGSTWLIPTYEFTDGGGYLGAVKGIPRALLLNQDASTAQNQ